MSGATGLKAFVQAIPPGEWPLSIAEIRRRLTEAGFTVGAGALRENLSTWAAQTDEFSSIYRLSVGIYDHRSHREEAR